MAVYTEIADEELAAFIDGYDMGAALSLKGIAEGVENSNFLLRAEAGSFILTLYEKRVNPGDLPFFIGLMEHLAARGVNCPVPVKNRKGEALGRLAGRPACVVTFLDGVSVRKPGVGHCRELGVALAGLHEAANGFALSRPNALGVAGWRPLFDAVDGRADDIAPGLGARIGAALAEAEANWPQGLPSGVIHADLFTDNVFFIGPKLSGVIDFYFACNDALAYDVAICLNAWCFEADGSFNLTKGQALLAGYQSVRRLTAEEIAALPLLCRGSALRFLLTRLVDWLNVPPGVLVKPKDPLEYDRKLAFHRSVTSASDYGLAA